MIKLFSTLYGSNLYGTASEESDRDVKHIVLPDINDALLGISPKNTVKKSNKIGYTKNTAEDTDEEYIPFQIFAKDILDGQTYALELAYAIEYSGAEQKIYYPKFLEYCRDLRNTFMTSNMTAMIGYAIKQASIYSDKGERLNAIQEVNDALASLEWFVVGEPKFAETKFNAIWQEIIEVIKPLCEKYPKYVEITEYSINSAGEMRPCIKILEKILPSTASFLHNMNTLKVTIDKYGNRARSAQADQVDWKATSHALRIINEGIILLSGKPLVYPYDVNTVNHLKAIKKGEVDYAEVTKEINSQMDILKTLQLTSTLPQKSHELRKKLDNWLLPRLKTLYQDFEGLTFNPERITQCKQEI
jgi:hypothetical protein